MKDGQTQIPGDVYDHLTNLSYHLEVAKGLLESLNRLDHAAETNDDWQSMRYGVATLITQVAMQVQFGREIVGKMV